MFARSGIVAHASLRCGPVGRAAQPILGYPTAEAMAFTYTGARMRLTFRAVLITLTGALSASCAGTPSIDAAAEERAIRGLDEQWAPAVANGDVEAAVALYTPDATLLWPNAPAAKGTDAIRAMWTTVMKTPALKMTVVPEHVEIALAGDVATDVGRIESHLSAPAGPVIVVSKYLHVWHKVGAEWKLYYSMANANAPPPAPAVQSR